MELHRQRKTDVIGAKPALACGLKKDRNRATEVTAWRLTLWATACPTDESKTQLRLKIQLVMHRKYTAWVLKPASWEGTGWINTACSEIHKNHRITSWGQDREFLSVRPGGTWRNRWAFKGCVVLKHCVPSLSLKICIADNNGQSAVRFNKTWANECKKHVQENPWVLALSFCVF